MLSEIVEMDCHRCVIDHATQRIRDSLHRHVHIATGKSRKLAKRKAALSMMKKLSVENLTIPKDMLDMLEEGTLKLVSRPPPA